MRYMLHTLLAAAVTVALAATPTEASTKRHQKGGGGGAHAMTGCLAKGTEANSYTLNSVEGKGPKTVEIIETASGVDLAPHVGHKVTITGTTIATKAAAKVEAKGAGKKATKSE